MGLDLFVSRRRLVLHGGRRYLCRRPPFGVVIRFLELYGAEIRAAAQHLIPEISQEAALGILIPIFLGWRPGESDSRAGELLEQCVETAEGPGFIWEAVTLDRDLAPKLVRAILSLTDIDAILRMTNLREAARRPDPAVEQPETEGAGFDEQLAGLLLMCGAIGISPREVMDWPAEAVERANQCLPDLLAARRGGGPGGHAGSPKTWSRAALGIIPGIGAHKVTH